MIGLYSLSAVRTPPRLGQRAASGIQSCKDSDFSPKKENFGAVISTFPKFSLSFRPLGFRSAKHIVQNGLCRGVVPGAPWWCSAVTVVLLRRHRGGVSLSPWCCSAFTVVARGRERGAAMA